jgi:hypothetical protein
VFGLEDKRQVIVIVLLAATCDILHFQVVFQGLISRVLPSLNDGRRECVDCGWDLTFSHKPLVYYGDVQEFCQDNFIKLFSVVNHSIGFTQKMI